MEFAATPPHLNNQGERMQITVEEIRTARHNRIYQELRQVAKRLQAQLDNKPGIDDYIGTITLYFNEKFGLAYLNFRIDPHVEYGIHPFISVGRDVDDRTVYMDERGELKHDNLFEALEQRVLAAVRDMLQQIMVPIGKHYRTLNGLIQDLEPSTATT